MSMKNQQEIIYDESYCIQGPEITINGIVYMKSSTPNASEDQWIFGGTGCSISDCSYQDTSSRSEIERHEAFGKHTKDEHFGDRVSCRPIFLWQAKPDYQPPPEPPRAGHHRYIPSDEVEL